jgi:hypothetical protein
MAAWLSFWNAATRRRTEERLSGTGVSEIYVPWGKQKLKRGDAIFCVYIADDELHLITRVIDRSTRTRPTMRPYASRLLVARAPKQTMAASSHLASFA